MIRIVAIAIGLALLIFLVLRIVREAQASRFDWKGIVFMIAFVALAFWLRDLWGLN